MLPEIDLYLEEGCGRCELYRTAQCKVHSFPEELRLLRQLVLETGLTEEYKWKQPCYTFNGKNILIVTAYKDFAVLAFFKGSLISDTHNMLVAPGENSQGSRQMRFTTAAEITSNWDTILSYVFQAIEVEKAGLKVEYKKDLDPIPIELQELIDRSEELKSAFESLTSGRKRSYILHINGAKQEKTRISRAEKCIPKILMGKGFNEY